MNENEKIIANLNKIYSACDLKKLEEKYVETNKLIVTLTENLFDKKIELIFWKENIEILLVKYSFHSFSLTQLLNGTIVSNSANVKRNFHDLPTIRLIIRALIENYLTIYYLIFEPKDNDIGEFRYYQYQLSGLYSRQNSDAFDDEHIKKKETERKEIESLLDLIKNNRYFNTLEIKEQKSLLKRNNARNNFTWERMIEISDLKKEMIFPLWKLFSNTAHSELIGSIQFKEYIKSDTKLLNEELRHNLTLLLMLNSTLILNIKKHIPKANGIFKENQNTINVEIAFWNKLIKKNIC